VEAPAPYTGNRPYLFVSYSHADETIVMAEIVELQNLGFHVWYDTGITPGSEWTEELARRIKNAERFLYFITPNSVESEHCRREVNFAQAEGKEILAVHLEDTKLPDGLRLSLDNRQAILRWKLSDASYQELLQGALSDRRDEVTAQLPSRKKATTYWLTGLATILLALIVILRFTGLAGPASEEQLSGIETYDRNLVVRPFRDLNRDKPYQWLADTLQAELNRELDLAIGYTLVPQSGLQDQPRGQSETPRVDFILDGYLRRTSTSLQLALELMDAGTGECWEPPRIRTGSVPKRAFSGAMRVTCRLQRNFSAIWF